MSTITHEAHLVLSSASPAHKFRSLEDYLAAKFSGFRAGLAMMNRYNELSSLSCSELKRRGIKRMDIPRLAFEAGSHLAFQAGSD